MWEKFIASLLATLLPAGLLTSPIETPISQDLFPIHQPSIRLSDKEPLFNAESVFVFDLDSSETFLAKNAENRLPMASLTKLMTALVVAEVMNPMAVVEISDYAAARAGAKMGLKGGERYSIGELLKGLLIPSGNDAAVALAEAVSGSEEAFVILMNKRAEALGLVNTHFVNTTGYDHPDHYSSAVDMGRIVSLVFQYKKIVDIMGTPSVNISTADGAREFEIRSTNKLLEGDYSKFIVGGKTGTTQLAQQCLVEVVENIYGKRIAYIILGSQKRYSDAVAMMDWHSEVFRW
jgi:serine-type D-Ala-D-Ala carboxypeptidase (penicillin-binding protein 5/6)